MSAIPLMGATGPDAYNPFRSRLTPKRTSRRRATRRFTGLTNKKWSSTAPPVYPALMPAFICTACGTQYPPSEALPGACLICTDERQFVPASGQSWTTLEGLRNAHSNKFRRLATGLTTIETTPAFGIGQRAIFARTPGGNVLWDCLALIDDRDGCFAVDEVNQQALFGRVAAVVHHGGAGTTTTATRAGAPQVVVPQLGEDQPYFAGRVAELGIGVAHDGPTPTYDSLSAALATVLAPDVRTRARAVAGMLRTDGTTVAAKMLHDMVSGEGRSTHA